jgi:hypothetical protein
VLEIVGYVLLGLLALILLVPAFPVFVRLTFFGELTVTVFVMGIPVFRFSSAASSSDAPQKETTKPKPQPPEKDKPPEKKENPLAALAKQLKYDGVGAVLHTVGELARIAGGAFKRVLRSITVDRLQLRLTVAAKDASDTAQTTGKICAVLYPSLSVLQYALRIKKRAVTVVPDYLAEKGAAEADVTVHVVPYRLLWAAIRAFFAYRKWNTQLMKATKTVEEE